MFIHDSIGDPAGTQPQKAEDEESSDGSTERSLDRIPSGKTEKNGHGKREKPQSGATKPDHPVASLPSTACELTANRHARFRRNQGKLPLRRIQESS